MRDAHISSITLRNGSLPHGQCILRIFRYGFTFSRSQRMHVHGARVTYVTPTPYPLRIVPA